MQRDFFLATLINDRERPSIALPIAAGIRIAEADMLFDGSGYRVNGLAVGSLPDVCRVLQGSGATHLQVYDQMPDGRRVPCIFCDIADTAAWRDPPPSAPADAQP